MWEENKQKTADEMTAVWMECSTDGVCNEAQWITANNKLHEQLEAKGIITPTRGEEHLKALYATLNKWTPETEGISVSDFWKQYQLRGVVTGEVMAEFAPFVKFGAKWKAMSTSVGEDGLTYTMGTS